MSNKPKSYSHQKYPHFLTNAQQATRRIHNHQNLTCIFLHNQKNFSTYGRHSFPHPFYWPTFSIRQQKAHATPQGIWYLKVPGQTAPKTHHFHVTNRTCRTYRKNHRFYHNKRYKGHRISSSPPSKPDCRWSYTCTPGHRGHPQMSPDSIHHRRSRPLPGIQRLHQTYRQALPEQKRCLRHKQKRIPLVGLQKV